MATMTGRVFEIAKAAAAIAPNVAKGETVQNIASAHTGTTFAAAEEANAAADWTAPGRVGATLTAVGGDIRVHVAPAGAEDNAAAFTLADGETIEITVDGGHQIHTRDVS